MMFRLAPSAISDIDSILAHISTESPNAADAVAARFDEVFETLAEFPNVGRRTNRKALRWINTYPYPYLIFYRTSRTLTEIVAIRHGARNPRSMPARPR